MRLPALALVLGLLAAGCGSTAPAVELSAASAAPATAPAVTPPASRSPEPDVEADLPPPSPLPAPTPVYKEPVPIDGRLAEAAIAAAPDGLTLATEGPEYEYRVAFRTDGGIVFVNGNVMAESERAAITSDMAQRGKEVALSSGHTAIVGAIGGRHTNQVVTVTDAYWFAVSAQDDDPSFRPPMSIAELEDYAVAIATHLTANP